MISHLDISCLEKLVFRSGVRFLFLFVLTDAILLKLDLQKGHRIWTILQMESCLSIKNASYIQKLGMCFFIFNIKLP